MRTTSRLSKNRGFTLVEIAVVLIIIAVLIGMAAMITRGVTAAQKRSLTATRIATVDAALVQFVATQRRLPCPADGTLASADANAGVERWAAGACNPNTQVNGVVPWRTLGLGEVDTSDGYDRRLTYRVNASLVAVGGMDMSWCDPAGQEAPLAPAAPRVCNTACTAAALTSCTPPLAFLVTKGLLIQNMAGTPLMTPAANTGAAYVVISHGESGGGGYMFGGGANVTASSSVDGTEEQKNYVNLPLAAYYVDDTLAEGAGAGHFDDILSRPSVIAVISRAGLGPRAH
jgi:prepilin-type N-terminal cleavage/methylation domain-containing protein